MLDDIFGAVVGTSLGQGMRGRYFDRKLRLAHSGRVRIRVRAHPADAPDWRYWRGALIRRGGRILFCPLVRRWRRMDLSDAAASDGGVRRSAADGDRAITALVGVDGCDHLACAIDAGPAVRAVFERNHS